MRMLGQILLAQLPILPRAGRRELVVSFFPRSFSVLVSIDGGCTNTAANKYGKMYGCQRPVTRLLELFQIHKKDEIRTLSNSQFSDCAVA